MKVNRLLVLVSALATGLFPAAAWCSDTTGTADAPPGLVELALLNSAGNSFWFRE